MARPCQCWRCQLNRLEDEVALELKGLKANMMRLHKRIDTLNQLASAGDTKGGELEKALNDVGTQLAGHLDDLTFAANVLGNSAGQSGEPVEPPKPLPATQPAPTYFDAPVAIPESPRAITRVEVGLPGATNFPSS